MKYFKVAVVSVLFTSSLFAQNIKTADAFFKNYNFVDAARVYENLITKGFDSPELRSKLADAYYLNSNYSEAAFNYLEYIKGVGEISKLSYFRLAKSLDGSGDFEKAAVYYKLFNKDLSKGKSVSLKIPVFKEFITNNVTVFEASIFNTTFSEYPVLVVEDELMLVSNRNEKKDIDPWTNLPYSSLLKTNIQSGEAERLLSKALPYHEGSAAINLSGDVLYVTLNTVVDKKKDKEALLRIARFVRKNKSWKYDAILPFSQGPFNTAHPALNEKGTKMYFASDRPGGYGASDLYVVNILEDGSFSNPENLGEAINTLGRESFPQITPSGELVFASDGHKGFGGYDLFGVNLNAIPQVAINLGEPINSNSDDFQWVHNSLLSGYFASNRNTLKRDDVYAFELKKPLNLTPINIIKGNIIVPQEDSVGAIEFNLSQTENSIDKLSLEKKGGFTFSTQHILENTILSLDKEGFDVSEVIIPITPAFEVIDLGNIILKKSITGLDVGDDLAKFFDIEQIYFDFDQWDIASKSIQDLAKIAETLILYPQLSIQILSHTDTIGAAAYNKTLSEKRAKSTYDNLIELGVPKERMTYKGYGENLPVIKCQNCSKEDQSLNRRSEFIIIEN